MPSPEPTLSERVAAVLRSGGCKFDSCFVGSTFGTTTVECRSQAAADRVARVLRGAGWSSVRVVRTVRANKQQTGTRLLETHDLWLVGGRI